MSVSLTLLHRSPEDLLFLFSSGDSQLDVSSPLTRCSDSSAGVGGAVHRIACPRNGAALRSAANHCLTASQPTAYLTLTAGS